MANRLSPQSDQNQFSLVNFNSFKPREKVLRTNNENNHRRENVFIEIHSTSSLWKCMEITLPNFYVDLGA